MRIKLAIRIFVLQSDISENGEEGNRSSVIHKKRIKTYISTRYGALVKRVYDGDARGEALLNLLL
jgi:hypothetical protein